MTLTERFEGLILAFSYLYELAKGALILVAVIVIVQTFIGTIFVIEGASMEPNLHSGQLIAVNKLGYLVGTPNRGDVVVLRFPGDPFQKRYIKRLIGIPGDAISFANGAVVVNGQPLSESYLPSTYKTTSTRFQEFHLGADEYMALGDNRPISNDSRIWGFLRRDFIIGKASFVLWPTGNSWGLVSNPQYSS